MDLNTKLTRDLKPLTSHIDDDLVIFSAENGMYYGTEVVGNRIWSLIEHETTISKICDQLMQEFVVERETCEREVLAFLGQLEQEGLIMVS
ncbi:PqqD family peptide modification chaperone [Halomonas kalidii]|uniref:PqqD family peptide modification chaperone n=1 Tax=Halomonas kalidii TaxID=3043293 RepID=A0ABT6VJL9_9GAMM|nr:PqqD family peptide modification chaperone [Halomonas kalidii]MDI5934178.1 PqqD family peptide modification chaperone [Halomonas kalidii]